MNKTEALNRLTSIENEARELRKIIETPETPSKPSAEERFWQLCQDLTMKIDREKYPNSIFFFKEDEYMFEYDTKNNYLWCRWKHIWSVFENEYGMQYTEIQSLIKKLVEEHFKFRGVTPPSVPVINCTG